MRYFWTAFKTEFIIRFRSRSYLLFCLLAVAITLVMVFFVGKETQVSIQVGVLIQHEEQEDILDVLQEKNKQIITFIPADAQVIDSKILSGEWDCAIEFPKDFEERLEKLDLEKIILIKTGPSSTVYPIVEEVVSSAIMDWVSPYLAQDYLHKIGIEDASVMGVYSKWEQQGSWVELEMATSSGEPLHPVGVIHSAKIHIFTGLAAVFILVWGIYLSVDLGKWLQSFAAIRFASVCPTTQLLVPKLSASLLPVLVWGFIFFGLMGCSVIGLAAYAAFMLTVMALNLVIPRFSGLWESGIALIPFLVMTSLLLEPVLLDTAMLFPKAAAITKWFPVSLFLNAYGGEISSLCILLAESVLLMIFSALLDYAGK